VSRVVVWNVRVGSFYTEVVMTVVPVFYLLLKLQQGKGSSLGPLCGLYNENQFTLPRFCPHLPQEQS